MVLLLAVVNNSTGFSPRDPNSLIRSDQLVVIARDLNIKALLAVIGSNSKMLLSGKMDCTCTYNKEFYQFILYLNFPFLC